MLQTSYIYLEIILDYTNIAKVTALIILGEKQTYITSILKYYC